MVELYQDEDGKQVIAGPKNDLTCWVIYEPKKVRVEPDNDKNKQLKQVLEPVSELPVLEFKAIFSALNAEGKKLLRTKIVEPKKKKTKK